MGFEFPWAFLFFIILVPLFLILRRSELLTKKVVRSFKCSPPSRRHFILRYGLVLAFVGSLVLVGARPYVEPQKTGDYLFLSDTSRSMQARNSCGEPTFLGRSKEVMRDVLAGVPEGRFGVLAFDRLTFPITQLTYDHVYLREVLNNGLSIGMAYKATGTDLAQALSVVAKKKHAFPHIYGDVRYVILLSDGYLDEGWRKNLEQPLIDLQAADIRVVAVGIGNPVATQIPVVPLTGPAGECRRQFIEVNGEEVRIVRRSDILSLIATETRGKYFEEGQMSELIEFIREETLVDAPKQVEFSAVQRNDISWIFLILATIAFLWFTLE